MSRRFTASVASLLLSTTLLQAQPVALDFYNDLSSLPVLYPNVQSYYLSSYDRSGGNDDGFRGTYSQLYIDDNGAEVSTVSVEFKQMALDDATKADILQKLVDKIKEMTYVTMRIEEVPHGTLPRFEYKARRWTDERIEGLERVKYIEK